MFPPPKQRPRPRGLHSTAKQRILAQWHCVDVTLLDQAYIKALKPTHGIVRMWTSMILGAVALVSQIVAGETNNSSSFALGVANVQSNGWSEAIINFTRAINDNPKDALAYDYRGAAYFATGDLDNAVKDFTQVVQLDATNARSLCNRANAYSAKREFEKAIRDFDASLRLNPTNTIAYLGRAAIYSERREFAKAITDWSDVLRLSPSDSKALTSRAWDYSKTGQFNIAVQDCKEAIRLDPQNDRAYNNLSWLRATCPVAEIRNGKEAVVLATRACELTNWNRWDWVDTLAAAYAEAGDFKNAINYQKQAMEMSDVTESYRKEMQRCLSLYEQEKPNHEGPKQ